MNKKQDIPSLSKLYKSEQIRNTVRTILSEDYEDAFGRLMKEATNVRSLLVDSAKLNKFNIKELVIEYGYQFETLEQLKICLDTIKVWNKIDECRCECDGLGEKEVISSPSSPIQN